jgi:hypothetical protein
MAVIEHGNWQVYAPATVPPGAPGNTLFARRAESDGADWYQYVNNSSNFQANTVKLTVFNNIVAAATIDPTTLFPGNALVLEVTDVPLDDLYSWSRKVYDPATQTFSDPAPLIMEKSAP